MDARDLNRALKAGRRRADDLEEQLAAVLQPILEQAANEAAAAFERYAVDFQTASARVEGALAAAAGLSATTAMVAVFPRPDEQDALAAAGDQDPAIVHCTLVFLGDVPDDNDVRAIVDALRPVAARHAPLAGAVGGVGVFNDGGEGHPLIALPDVVGLDRLRVDVAAALADAGVSFATNHGFLPHLTLLYAPEPSVAHAPVLGEPLHFDGLYLVRGDQVEAQLPLVGAPALTAAGDDQPQPPPWAPPDPGRILDVTTLVEALRKKIDPVRAAMVETVMDGVLTKIGVRFDLTNPHVARVMAQAGSQVVGIGQATQNDVMRAVNESYRAGLSIRDTAKVIRSQMAEASTKRAITIARTELAGAVNGGSLAATQIVASETGVGFRKTWRTAPGAKYPRHEDYDDLDGQQADLDGYFHVGDADLHFPGDPDGPPEEVVNCRCTLTYEESEGA